MFLEMMPLGVSCKIIDIPVPQGVAEAAKSQGFEKKPVLFGPVDDSLFGSGHPWLHIGKGGNIPPILLVKPGGAITVKGWGLHKFWPQFRIHSCLGLDSKGGVRHPTLGRGRSGYSQIFLRVPIRLLDGICQSECLELTITTKSNLEIEERLWSPFFSLENFLVTQGA